VPWRLGARGGAGRARGRDGAAPDARAAGAFRFCLVLASAYVLVLSLGNNRADRFIFPAYFVLGAAGAAAAVRRWPAPSRLAEKVRALGGPGTAALWLVLFVITLASSRQLPRVKIWP
jgi:hypothetical protein